MLPIWEGTTNVLSVDVLRALGADAPAKSLLARVDAALDAAHRRDRRRASRRPGPPGRRVRRGRRRAIGARGVAGARDLALLAADVLIAALLVEQAVAGSDERAATAADLWVRGRIARVDVGSAAAEAYPLVCGLD